MELARRTGARRPEGVAWCLLGEALLLAGRWVEAEECLQQSIAVNQAVGSKMGEALTWQRLAELAVFRGRTAEAEEYVQRGLQVATLAPMGATHLMGRLYATAAFNAVESGDGVGTQRALELLAEAPQRYGDCPACTALVNPVAAEAYVALGSIDRAQAHAQAAEQAAANFGSAGWQAMAKLARGFAARGAGEAASHHFIAAAELYDQIGQPYYAARSLLQAGCAEAEAGHREDACRLLERAQRTFQELGAKQGEAQASAALRALPDSDD